jgi:hypothetical protein
MYDFKLGPELAWAVLVTVVGAMAMAIAAQGALPPTDWKVWAIGLATGIARAVVALILSKVPDNAAS